MTLPAPTYDLVMLLDPLAEDATRAKLVADARTAIEAQGEFLRHDEWGNRALTYPIDRKTHAEYHLLQFHAGTSELLSGLDRSLRIADDVIRFRIIKLAPGVPEAPDMAAAPTTARPAEAEAAVEPTAAVESTESPAEAETETAEVAVEAEVETAVVEPS